MSKDAEKILEIGLGNWGLRFLKTLEWHAGVQMIMAGSLDQMLTLALLERICTAAMQSYGDFQDACRSDGCVPMNRAVFEERTRLFFVALAAEYGGTVGQAAP